MAKTSSKAFMLILFGLVIGFSFALATLNLQNMGVRGQINSSDKKVALQNQNTENCTIADTAYFRNQNNESLNLTEIKNEYTNNAPNINETTGLLSPRVYSGLLEPRSFLITSFEPLKQGIESFLKEQDISASIYIENLRNGASMGINEDYGYFPASLNKLPVAVLIMQRVEDGKLSLGTMLPIKDYEKTDSYGTLYLTKENQLPVRVLLKKMLQESDNTAFNVLFDNIDKDALVRLLNYYNLKENIEYPFKRLEYEDGTNLVTPVQMYNIFASLYLSTALYAQDSEYILSLLSKTDFNIKELADLPDNLTVVDKFGEYYLDDSKLFHDCGIMYIGQGRFFYCIMMKNIEPEDAKQYIGYLVNYIYNYVIDTRIKYGAFRLPSNNTK